MVVVALLDLGIVSTEELGEGQRLGVGLNREAPKRVQWAKMGWRAAGDQAYIDCRIFDSTTDQVPSQVL
jgi:hypothetical protein